MVIPRPSSAITTLLWLPLHENVMSMFLASAVIELSTRSATAVSGE